MRPRLAAPQAAIALALAAGLVAAIAPSLAPRAEAQQQRALRKFMRQKLDYSQAILEGLALEDYALIAKNAAALKELSQDAQWRVSPNVNYLRLSDEFQGLADDLAARAKDRNLDGATLGFFKLTNNCIACHRLVRDERLITRAPGEKAPDLGPGSILAGGR